MAYSFIYKKLKSVILLLLILVSFSANSQNRKVYAQSLSNPYGVPENVWRIYLNKTNLLLEKVDYKSFLNYVVFSNDGNFNDMNYFVNYVGGKLKKDKLELINRVGTGKIKSTSEVSKYFSDLQPLYNNYYLDFKKRRDVIVSSLSSRRAPGTGVNPTPLNCGSPCTNPGFESGTGFWDYYTGTACASSTSDPCSIVAGFSSSQHVIQTVGGFDPIVGGTLLPVVDPGGGSSSLMLGDGSTTGGYASRASISFTVSAANSNFTYRYACVLQDPNDGLHTDPERPYFNVHVRDAAGNTIGCGEYMVMAKPPMAGFIETSPGSAIWWHNWTAVNIPLNTYIGQCVTIQFTSSDCSQGGHFGYAYIDGDCDPLVLLTSSPSVCGGSDVILTAPLGAATYSWTNTAGGTTGIVGSTTSQTCTVNAGGTYQCVITTDAGPACATTLTIVVGTSPANPIASFNNTTVCSGLPTDFTDTSTPLGSINSWSWDFNGDGVPDATTQNPSYTFPAAGTYPVTLIATWGPCNSTITQNVTVNASSLTTVNSPTICPATSATLTAAGATTYSWSTGAITNPITVSPAVTTTYTVTGTTSGCTSSAIATVTVSGTLAPSVNSPTICAGGTATLTAAGGATYTWSTGSTANPLSVTPAATTSYTVTAASAGCTGTVVATVTVNPLPVLTITDPAAVCSPGTVDITAAAVTAGSTGGGVLSYWTDAAGTIPLVGASAVSTSGTYYIQSTVAASCTDIAPVVVTINPSPISDAGLDVTICTGGVGNIGSASVVGNTYSWSPVLGLSNATLSNPTVTLINGGAASSTNPYTVTTTNTASGCTSTDVVNVIVDVVATANAGTPQSVCIGSSITLGGAVAGSASGGTWSGGTGTYAPNNTTLNAVYTPSAAEYAAGSITLTLTTNDPTGPCTFASSNVTFSFYQTPVVSFVVDDPDGCPVHCVQFTDNSTVGGGDNIVSWSWNYGEGGAGGNTQNPANCYELPGFYNVTLTVTSNQGCSASLTIPAMIHVFNMPTAEFSVSPNPASVLDPIVTLNNQSSSDVNYWFYYFGDGDSIVNIPSPVHSYPDAASSTYIATLIVHNADGCWDTVQHPVEIGPEFTFYIPNAFTPNGDGVNDYFYGQGIGIVAYDLYIFDRWGNMIFHGHDLNDMWNGKANGGDDMAQQDVYVWKVKLTDVFGKKHNYIGTVTLVK